MLELRTMLNTPSSPLDVAQRLLKASPFGKTEVAVHNRHQRLTRYGGNQITQNVDKENWRAHLRVIEEKNGKTYTVATESDQLDDSTIVTAYRRIRTTLDILEEQSGSDPAPVASFTAPGAN